MTDEDKVKYVYDRLDVLLSDVMGAKYAEMNDRTPKQFWDDGQKRQNAYVRTREAQDKEEWQANVFTGSTRNKVRSYVSSVSKDVPLISMTATSESGERSADRARWLKNAVRHSFVQGANPEMTLFLDGWNAATVGTVIKHDYWRRGKSEWEDVTEWDASTSKLKFVMAKGKGTAGCAEECEVPPERLIPGDAYVPDIQDQPELIWIEYWDEAKFTEEFGKFPAFGSVRPGGGRTSGETDLFFGNRWGQRTEKCKYEVLRFYAKRLLEEGENGKKSLRSCYRIVANGVLMLDAPLLWGGKEKVYPFSKAVFEPFAKPMFWGNSLPNIVMDLQDEENALSNSMLDKVHRSVETPLLIGNVNKDDFDLEDRLVTGSDRIYVQNVDAVKPLLIPAPTQGEFAMLQRVGKMLEDASLDALQGGSAGSGSTAREVLIANERANDNKGLFFLSLKDLWIQKTRLRTALLIEHWDDRDGSGGYAVRNVDGAELSDGSKGTMRLMVAEPARIAAMNRIVGYGEGRQPYNAVDVMEEEAKMKGEGNTEIMAIPPGYLDGWKYEIEIQSETLRQRGKSLDMAYQDEFTSKSSTLFPEIFAANRRKFFDEMAKQYGQNPSTYSDATPAMRPGASAPNRPVPNSSSPAALPELAV